MLSFLQKFICEKIIQENAALKLDAENWQKLYLEKEDGCEQKLKDRQAAYDYLYGQYTQIRDYIDGENIPKPQKYTKFSKSQLAQIFRNNNIYVNAHFADNEYWAAAFDDIMAFLHWDLTNRNRYIAETYDCDDFSFRLKGQFTVPGWSQVPSFIVWTQLHAFNAVIDAAGKLWFIEPQNDLIFEPSEKMHEQYKNVRIIIG
jgi:hypothetical protein